MRLKPRWRRPHARQEKWQTPKRQKRQPPLHHAARQGQTSHVKLLFSRGANARGKDGKTPLHYAVKKRNADAAELPLKHGADTNAKNNHGKTPVAELPREPQEATRRIATRRYIHYIPDTRRRAEPPPQTDKTPTHHTANAATHRREKLLNYRVLEKPRSYKMTPGKSPADSPSCSPEVPPWAHSPGRGAGEKTPRRRRGEARTKPTPRAALRPSETG